MDDWFVRTAHGIYLNIYVQAGSSCTKYVSEHGGRLKIKVADKAIDGAPNLALCTFIARSFKLPKHSVSIIRGESARNKTIEVKGNPHELEKKLSALLDQFLDTTND
jgi:uncharacterized protein (TIGR00251 family)